MNLREASGRRVQSTAEAQCNKATTQKPAPAHLRLGGHRTRPTSCLRRGDRHRLGEQDEARDRHTTKQQIGQPARAPNPISKTQIKRQSTRASRCDVDKHRDAPEAAGMETETRRLGGGVRLITTTRAEEEERYWCLCCCVLDWGLLPRVSRE